MSPAGSSHVSNSTAIHGHCEGSAFTAPGMTFNGCYVWYPLHSLLASMLGVYMAQASMCAYWPRVARLHDSRALSCSCCHCLPAVLYTVCGIPLGFYLWYWKLYNGAKSDSTFTFISFFFWFAVHTAFCIYAAIGE